MNEIKSISLLCLFLLSSGCSENKTETPSKSDTTAIASDSEMSIYSLASHWVDCQGKEMKLSDLAGKPQVLAIIFTSCPSACPRLVSNMKQIENALGTSSFDSVGFVLVTMDPEHDTPQVLRSFANEHGLDLHRWTLLHGSDNDVLELANALDVRIRKMSGGTFDHSNIIHILDRNGVVVYQQTGLNSDNNNSVTVLNKLLRAGSSGQQDH